MLERGLKGRKMAEIKPFKGVLYNPDKIKDFSSVVAPPYDVISPEARQELMKRNEANIVRLILPGDEKTEGDRYESAAGILKKWLDDGTLVRDDKESIYLYEQEFTVLGKRECRTGFLSLVKLEELDSGIIKPHENTMDGPKADRLRLLTATQANLCSILGCFSDPDLTVDRLLEAAKPPEPVVSIVEKNSDAHRLYRITEKSAIQAITEDLSARSIFIADGHHRYETALNYRKSMVEESGAEGDGPKSYDYILMYLANMDSPGLKILPYHRAVRPPEGFNREKFMEGLKENFSSEGDVSADDPIKVIKEVSSKGESARSFGLYMGDSTVKIFSMKTEGDEALGKGPVAELPKAYQHLDVIVVHTLLFNELIGIDDIKQKTGGCIDYFSDPGRAIKAVDDGKAEMAFILNPVSVDEFQEVSSLGLKMPQKSTFFYPKLLTGLVINIHNG